MKRAIATAALLVWLCSCYQEHDAMGLPDTREHSYGPNEPVRSTDLNAIQDAIIGGKYPAETVMQPVPALVAGSYLLSGGAGAANVGPAGDYHGAIATATVENIIIPCTLDLAPGDRITHLKLSARGTGAGGSQLTAKLVKNGILAGVMGNTPGEAVDTGAACPATDVLYSKTLVTPVTVAAGDHFVWLITFAVIGDLAWAVGLTKDRL